MRRLLSSSRNRFGLLAGLLATALPLSTHAAGFYLADHSASGLGTAYAGTITDDHDASTIYYNPAGMTALGGGMITGDATLIAAHSNIDNAGSTFLGAPTSGPNGGNPIITSVLPSGFIAYPIYEDRVWAGFGFTTPFGLSVDYPDNWFGRFNSIESNLRTFDFQPSLAVKITDWLSIGGGADYQRATARLTSAVFAGTTGSSTLRGDADDWGWTGGVTVTPLPGTKIGFDYRSQINHTLKGNLNVSGSTGANVNSGASGNLDLPWIASVGVSQDIDPQWTVMGQVQRFGWDRFHDLTVTLDSGATAETIPEQYKNTWNISAGAEYHWTPEWTFRGGYMFDQTPTGSDRDTRVPDGNRNWFTVGTTWSPWKQWSFDLAGAFINVNKTGINVTNNSGLATTVAKQTGSQIGLVSAGISYKF